MHVFQAIYECGNIHFQDSYPQYDGPVVVVIVFPDPIGEVRIDCEETLRHVLWDEDPEDEIPW